MMGRTHQVIGLATTTSLYLIASPVPAVSADFAAALAVTTLASVLPDIDATASGRGDPIARRMLGIGNNQSRRNVERAVTNLARSGAASLIPNLLYLVWTLLWGAVVAAFNTLMKIVGHRGLTHWAITWLCLTALLLIPAIVFGPYVPYLQSPPLLALAFSLAYASHLASDMMTKSGLKVLSPFSDKTYHLLPKRWTITTGSFTESVLFAGISALLIAMLALYYRLTADGVDLPGFLFL